MQATLNRHFMRGGSHYPVGGSSEIAYNILNILPVIEEAGCRVLVRASVTHILERDGRVGRVRVVKGTHEILASMVISSAGQRFFQITRQSIVGSDGMTQSDCSLNACLMLSECSECPQNACLMLSE